MKNLTTGFKRSRLVAAITAGLMISSASAFASESQSKVEIKLDAQKVGTALLKLSKQSGYQIVLADGVSRDIDVPALSGEYRLSDALNGILKGTGLTYEYMSEDMVMIRAEDPAEAEQAKEKEVVEEMVVTGSRLRNVSPTQPTTVITMDQIKAQGINSVEDIVRSLPQNYANVTLTSAIDNSSSVGTLGNAAANLRGLGSDGTLVLVNGRRVAGSTVFSGSTVNLNTIPFAAIERVEVVTDGASAIYGADAVAGVINFILRKGYDAEETTSVRYESARNGGDKMRFEQSLGFSWGSGNMSGTMSYEEIKPVVNSKVGWTTMDQRYRGGIDGREADSGYWPGAIYGPNQIVDLHDLYPDYYPPGTLYEVAGEILGAIGQSRDASQPVTLDDISTDNLEPYDYVPNHSSDARRALSVTLRADQEISETINAWVELNYARNKSDAFRGPHVETGILIPESNAFNNTGGDLYVDYAFAREAELGMIPYRTNVNDSKNIGVALGFDAELPFKDWRMEGFVNHSIESTYVRAFDGVNEAALVAAAADSNPDTAFNPFGDGTQQNSETISSLYFVANDEYAKPTITDGEATQINLSVNGALLELPGGDMTAAIGLDWRNELRQFDAYSGTLLTTTEPERDTMAVFSEVNIPIIGADNRLPLVDSLEFRVAARWEEYSIEGPFDGLNSASREVTYSNTSPSYGIAWHLTPEFKVRVNKGESFKVPQLSSLFAFPVEPYIVGYIASTIASQGITEDPVTGFPIVELGFGPSGNAEVQPELSDTTSFGFDWAPSGVLEGLSVSASYVEIETTDVIGSSFNLLFEDAYAYLTSSSVDRDPTTGAITAYRSKPINYSLEGVKAVDVNISYMFGTDWGQFEYGFTGTYTKEQYSQLLPTTERNYLDGDLRGPDRVKFRNWLTWSNGGYGSTLTMNYTDSYDYNPEAYPLSLPRRRVESHITFDWSGYYEMEGGLKFTGGVRNVLGTDFPYIINRTPFDPRRVDVKGRTMYLEVSKSFDLI